MLELIWDQHFCKTLIEDQDFLYSNFSRTENWLNTSLDQNIVSQVFNTHTFLGSSVIDTNFWETKFVALSVFSEQQFIRGLICVGQQFVRDHHI